MGPNWSHWDSLNLLCLSAAVVVRTSVSILSGAPVVGGTFICISPTGGFRPIPVQTSAWGSRTSVCVIPGVASMEE